MGIRQALFLFPHIIWSLINMSESEVYQKQEPLISVYGKNPPKAAEFGVGARTIEEIRDAAQKRRDLQPGQYGTR
jgi:hypothetical protein